MSLMGLKTRCSHTNTVEVESQLGRRGVVCRQCGAVKGHDEPTTAKERRKWDGFGVDLELHMMFMEIAGWSYPEGAYLTVIS